MDCYQVKYFRSQQNLAKTKGSLVATELAVVGRFYVATECGQMKGFVLQRSNCNTPKYTLVVFDMFKVFCKHNLTVL